MKNKKRMALIVENREFPSYLIYILPIVEHLRDAFDIDTFDKNEIAHINLSLYDIFYMVKTATPESLYIVLYANARNCPIIYETDDNFIAQSDIKYGKLHDKSNFTKSILAEILRGVNIVLVYSAKSYETIYKYNKNIIILPTYQICHRIVKEYDKSKKIIGYMGTQHHKDVNFFCVMPALEYISKKYNDIIFEFIGFKPKNAEKLNNISYINYESDYNIFLKKFKNRGWTIALAPLVDTLFNTSKTNTKYREYAAAGYPGIYSNIEPYSSTIQNKITGLLVENTTEEWINAIEILLKDSILRETISIKAKDDICNNYQFTSYKEIKIFILTSFMLDHTHQNIQKIINVVKNANHQIRHPSINNIMPEDSAKIYKFRCLVFAFQFFIKIPFVNALSLLNRFRAFFSGRKKICARFVTPCAD